MKSRRFGPLDVMVPIVGLGTWQMESAPRENAIAAIHRAIALGMTHIDTAEIYGKGVVEEIVGEALVGHRADVFLTSKVHPDRATYSGTLLACEKSLRRLRTDRIDLYLLHWRGTRPLDETFRAFDVLERDGKILSWGVSNFGVDDLKYALDLVGQGGITCNQVLYNLGEREPEHALIDFCNRQRVAFVGYSPLGVGKFPRVGTPGGDLLAKIAKARGMSPRAIVLAYLTRLEGTFAIPKSSVAAHVDELAHAGDLELRHDELMAIHDLFPLAPERH